MREDFSHTLDEALERLRAGDNIEECLAHYPDVAQELEPLLQVASIVEAETYTELSPDMEAWLVTGRREIEVLAARMSPRSASIAPGNRFFAFLISLLSWRSKSAIAIPLAIGLMVIVVATLVETTAASVPGHPLYAVKRTQEQVTLVLTPDPVKRSMLQVEYASERIAEFQSLVAQPEITDVENVERSLNLIDDQVETAMREAGEAGNGTQVQQQLEQLLSLADTAVDDAIEQNHAISTQREQTLQAASDTFAELRRELPRIEAETSASQPPSGNDASVAVDTTDTGMINVDSTATLSSTLIPTRTPTIKITEKSIFTPIPTRTATVSTPSSQAYPVDTPLPVATAGSSILVVPSETATRTALANLRPSGTPTSEPAVTATQTPVRPTATSTAQPEVAITPSPTPTAALDTPATATSVPSATPTDTVRPTSTLTPTRMATSTSTRTATPADIPAPSPTSTANATPIASDTPTPTRTPRPEATPTATDTLTPSDTPAPIPSDTPTRMPEPSDTPTRTPSPSTTPTRTPSPSATPTRTPSPSTTATRTPEPSDTPTRTPSLSTTATATDTPTPEDSATPSATPTPSRTAIPRTNPEVTLDRISPILECVVLHDDGTYTAYFGYNSEEEGIITIPIGTTNTFIPKPEDRGQPTDFKPGRQSKVFSVNVTQDSLVWKLGDQTATASIGSDSCQDEETTSQMEPTGADPQDAESAQSVPSEQPQDAVIPDAP